MKQITDEEIIKSLDVIRTTRNCEECKIRNCEWGKCNCERITASVSLDLINRQKAEIERLQNILICFMESLGKVRKVDDIDEISQIPILSELNKQYRASIKSEAYKEFAERLCDGKVSNDKTVIEVKVLLKEMVGDNDG